MVTAVSANLLLLFFYKYLSFVLSNLNASNLLNTQLSTTALPLGISYFTFTGISYIVDIWREVEPGERNFLNFANYLIMFPKLMLGPITRFRDVKENLPGEWFHNPDFIVGGARFIRGLGKKVILADNFALISNKIFESDFSNITFGVAWFGLFSFTLQIFFDFSGYTDMALGLGSLFGYRLPENFNFPYIARSVSDFWRRWHMSLTAWFRNYIFIPLEFKRKKAGPLRQPVNLLIVFLLTGLWHGAGWNFIIWGAYYGLILSIEALYLGKKLKRLPPALQHIYSLTMILIGWIFFWLTDLSRWGPFFRALTGGNGPSADFSLRSMNILLYTPLLILGALLSTPIPGQIVSGLNRKGLTGKLVQVMVYVGVFILAVSYILANGYQSFLYAQF